MDDSFGLRLRRQRERQQIALASIAEQTKIKLSLLEGLERDDLSHWPSGLFRRSYVRAYARAIGLDPEALVREFVQRHPDEEEDARALLAAVDDRGRKTSRPPTRLRFLLESAVTTLPSLRHHGERAPHASPHPTAPSPEPMLSAIAGLCTRLGQAIDAVELGPVLADARSILDATGLVLWILARDGQALAPVIVHGYPDDVRTRLPLVPCGADTAVSGAFRSASTHIVKAGENTTGAVIVPVLGPHGCVGVLALETKNGSEQRESVVALATILGAQLATLVAPLPLVSRRPHVPAQRAKRSEHLGV